jgi:hypothetical protein
MFGCQKRCNENAKQRAGHHFNQEHGDGLMGCARGAHPITAHANWQCQKAAWLCIHRNHAVYFNCPRTVWTAWFWVRLHAPACVHWDLTQRHLSKRCRARAASRRSRQRGSNGRRLQGNPIWRYAGPSSPGMTWPHVQRHGGWSRRFLSCWSSLPPPVAQPMHRGPLLLAHPA